MGGCIFSGKPPHLQLLTPSDICVSIRCAVKHDDAPHGWLGASPDGLIQGLATHTLTNTGGRGSSSGGGGTSTPVFPPETAAAAAVAGWGGGAARGAGVVGGEGAGVLEVKCPFNKGRPELAVPPQHAIWYYMPQV